MARRREPRMIEVNIVDIGNKGAAIGKTDAGEVVLVQDAVPGDRVMANLLRKKKGLWNGYVHEIISESPDRVVPECQHFEECGGCKWQHLSYAKQIALKEKGVYDAMQRLGDLTIGEKRPILGCEEIYYYRNKLEYSFSNKRWITDAEKDIDKESIEWRGLGFHRPGKFDRVLHLSHCHLQPSPSNEIRNYIHDRALELDLTYYDAVKKIGFLRNMIVRTTESGDLMVVLIVSQNDETVIETLLSGLKAEFPIITSLMYVINNKANDTIYDLPVHVYSGSSTIVETLRDKKYYVGPKSFFQTNTKQATRLYDIVVEFAEFKEDEVVYDLYSGLGSIALYAADRVGKMIGVEEVEEAVELAHRNIELNHADNCYFYCGDVRKVLNTEFVAKNGAPDTIIVDPPRAGLHADVVHFIGQLSPNKIVYVSCNPATQARDMALWKDDYDCVKMQPVDMFPHTSHVENVALLIKKT
ncbi:23S rRNA (uracil(1939)-C(5))-methyltransferase RlmD [Membranihabitans marinus]|uniref:23S rRNA (uracil(1939)-C(5))-methyltransferase RlmD n=1 Tax=Membranihabitans marinus TaxID=1227546 RepID=UPI001EFFAFE9|nr:23S rRNA (uracil(1939)-C(5))-methyltransferase RlmD [Membranihabitans marinus]